MNRRSEKEIAICEAIAALCADETDMGQLRVSDIARMAGIGKGTVYEYYASKEEMFFQAFLYILERELRRLLDTLENVVSFRETVMAVMRQIISLGPRGIMVIRTLFSQSSSAPGKHFALTHEVLMDYRGRLTDATDALIDVGVREGILKPCEADYRHAVLRCFYLGLIAFCPMDGDMQMQMEHTYTMLVKALN